MATFASSAHGRIWSLEFRRLAKSALAATVLETLACEKIAAKRVVRSSHHKTNVCTIPGEHSRVCGHVDRIFI